MASQSAENRKQRQAQALAIVEKLIEEFVSEDYLLNVVSDIRQTHYCDVVEERSLVNLCGYPLCTNTIPKLLTQKYHISRLNNKVYDITERKKFCSNQCYKSSKHYQDQLLSSPIWLDEEIPTVTLLPLNNKGSVGIEIEFSSFNISSDLIEHDDVPKFPSDKKIQNKKTASLLKPKAQTESSKPVLKQNEEIVEEKHDQAKLFQKTYSDEEIKLAPNVKSRKCNKLVNPTPYNDRTIPVSVVNHIEDVFRKWMTTDTLDYLLQDESVSPNQTGSSGKNRKAFEQNYEHLCQKLKLLEADEDLADKQLLGTESKPRTKLPEYEKLKKDAEEAVLKVKAFYKGQLDILPDSSDTGIHDISEIDKKNNSNPDELQSEEQPSVPVIDSQAQNLLRRRIVLDHLNNVYSQFQGIFGLRKADFSQHLRTVITTFRLTPHNIIFTPAEWMLVGIILLKLLSLKEPKLKELLGSQKTENTLNILLKNMQKDANYVNNFVNELLKKKCFE